MLEELATFCSVLRHGSMSRAASALHLTQPAVSLRLRALETKYGLELFRRTNRGVELTPAGEVLSRYANRLLQLSKSLDEEMNALRTEEPRRVVFGATSAAGGHALPCTLYLFQQKYPSATVELVVDNRTKTLQRLNDGVLDLALIEGPPLDGMSEELQGWVQQQVSEEDLVLITPVTGTWAEKPAFTLDDLRNAPLIIREEGSGTRQVIEQTVLAHGIRPETLNRVMTLSSQDAVKTSVAAGHGVALVSRWVVRAEGRVGTIRIAPLEGVRFTSHWTLCYPAARRRSMLTRSLIRTLRSPAERGFC